MYFTFRTAKVILIMRVCVLWNKKPIKCCILMWRTDVSFHSILADKPCGKSNPLDRNNRLTSEAQAINELLHFTPHCGPYCFGKKFQNLNNSAQLKMDF